MDVVTEYTCVDSKGDVSIDSFSLAVTEELAVDETEMVCYSFNFQRKTGIALSNQLSVIYALWI